MGSSWIKLVLAISIDGRITYPAGGAANIGGPGDRKLLEESLKWSDATLMGSKTLREHKSTCLIHNQQFINERRLKNQSSQPISLIVSRQNIFSGDWSYFQQPINRWLLTTSSFDSNQIQKKYFDHSILIKSNWSHTLKELAKEGLFKILLLGGAELVGSLLKEDQINEIQLTIAPKILGGTFPWVPFQNLELPQALGESQAWLIQQQRHIEGDEIVLNYIRNKT